MFYGVAFRAARPPTLFPDRSDLPVRVSQVRGGRLLAARVVLTPGFTPASLGVMPGSLVRLTTSPSSAVSSLLSKLV